MKRCLLAAMAGLMVLGSGCETLSDVVGSVNLEIKDVTPFVLSGARSGVDSGLKALSKDAASFDKTKKVAAEIETLVTDTVLPLFEGEAVRRSLARSSLQLIRHSSLSRCRTTRRMSFLRIRGALSLLSSAASQRAFSGSRRGVDRTAERVIWLRPSLSARGLVVG
jgi:hypothetical protein